MAVKVRPPATVGADPEVFLVDFTGKHISAVGLIGGSKQHPRDIGEGCAVQEDCVAAEFNIPPAKDVDNFVRSIKYTLAYLTEHVKAHGLSLSLTSSQSFDEDQLHTPQAVTFGCEPDFNAWTGQQNPTPRAKDKNLRTAAAHVHIGSNLNRIQLARWCDVEIGLRTVLEGDDPIRRELYGKAGCYRPKDYGIEYRTPGNYWLRDEQGMRNMFNRVQNVVAMVGNGGMLDDKAGDDIQMAINGNLKDLAYTLLQKYSYDQYAKL